MEDARAIAKIHIDTWRATYRGIMPDDLLSNLSMERREAFWRDAISGLKPSQVTVVAEEAHLGVTGFAFAGPERTGDPDYIGEIYAIYVLPAHHRRGIGKALFTTAAAHLAASSLPTLLVWVLSANPYRVFYDKLGGLPVRERSVEFGGLPLPEVGYGWTNVSELPLLSQHAIPAA